MTLPFRPTEIFTVSNIVFDFEIAYLLLEILSTIQIEQRETDQKQNKITST